MNYNRDKDIILKMLPHYENNNYLILIIKYNEDTEKVLNKLLN